MNKPLSAEDLPVGRTLRAAHQASRTLPHDGLGFRREERAARAAVLRELEEALSALCGGRVPSGMATG